MHIQTIKNIIESIIDHATTQVNKGTGTNNQQWVKRLCEKVKTIMAIHESRFDCCTMFAESSQSSLQTLCSSTIVDFANFQKHVLNRLNDVEKEVVDLFMHEEGDTVRWADTLKLSTNVTPHMEILNTL